MMIRKKSFLPVCTVFLCSFALMSYAAGSSGLGDVLTKIWGHAWATSLHYTGTSVRAHYSVGCTNRYNVKATCVYRLKIQLIKRGGQWDVEVSSNDDSGSGSANADNGDHWHNIFSANQSLNAPARNLQRGALYRIKTYTRMTVSVPGIGSEDWFSENQKDFRP